MQMIEFWMRNTLIIFQGAYYEHGRNHAQNDKGMTIGGYGSAFLEDLVAAQEMKSTRGMYEMAIIKGIYQDDEIMGMIGN